MAILPTLFRSPSRSILNFADERAREADSIGSVITKLAAPLVNQPQPLGTASAAQPSAIPVEFNPQSVERLNAADPRLRDMLTEVERRAMERGIDFEISETARDPQRQAELVAAGKSQTMNSKHLTGNAADIYVVGPDGQPNWDFAAYQPVADIAKEVAAERGYNDFVWGGDWNTLKDGVHFQLGGPSGGDGANSMIGGAGADTLGGGGMNVESILASLYPQMSPEEEKRQRRKDIFLALSQGLGAISQGRPVDVSNVVARSDERKRQAVLDMRERERARAAASLVYGQTGDRDLAAGIASGAISYGDVVSERERRRVQNEADANRLKQEQANGRLAGIVDSMWGDLGLPDSVRDEVIAGINAGDDPNTIFTLNEQAKVAEAARKAEEEAAAMADQRAAALESLGASTDPVDQMTARFLALDPGMSLKDAEATARERLKTIAQEGFTLSPGETRFGAGGEVVAAIPAASPTSDGFTLQPGETRFGPGGEVLATIPAAPQAPEEFAPAEAEKIWTTSRDLAEAQGPEALATFLAQFPNPAAFALAQSNRLGGAPSVIDTMNADLIPKGLMVVPDPANPALPLVVDGQVQTTEIEGGPAQQARLAREQTAAEEATKQAGLADKATLRQQQEEVRNTDTMRLVSDVYDYSQNFDPGAVSGYFRGVIANNFPASTAGQAQGQLSGVQVGIFVDQLANMRESSPTGAAVGNVTEGEREALASLFGRLDVGGDPDVLRRNLRAIANAGLDLRYGTAADLRKAVEEGKLDAETAERYGARYDVDGTADTGMAGDLGPVVPLGITEVGDTVLTRTEELVAPDSPDPEFEARVLADPTIIENMTLEDYKALSPEQKRVFDRLAGEE